VPPAYHALLTFFTIPKPFEGHAAVIQRNAIQSWIKAVPDCEVVLCGDEAGVSDVAREFSLKHIAAVERNSFGTPLLNSAFHLVQQLCLDPFICYINTDIIMVSDITKAIAMIPFPKFLMIGQRWDLDIEDLIDFSSPDWSARLEKERADRGTLQAPNAMDYFVFPRGTIGDIPPFAVGRPGWDNWIIYHARAERKPVIDATQAVKIIHQNHGYNHIPLRRGNAWEGPEGDRNRELVGGQARIFTLHDATWVLSERGLRRSWSPDHLKRLLPAISALYPRTRRLINGMTAIISLPGRVSASLKHRLRMLFSKR
jgi:hypothetical protein